ncbi:MAG: chloride channel protein [Halioglobus sp.]|nr:chloride channel protein [Halioglobus sp.]
MTNRSNGQAPDAIPGNTIAAVKPVSPRGLSFMILMAVAVGGVAGLGAWAFRMLIGLIHNTLFLGQFSVHYDANVFTPASPWGIGVVLVPVAGGLMVAWLVKNFAPEAKGHGVPEVMDAIYYNEGRIRPRVALVKSLASAISIGSGASVGREGPIVQIGSAFGSTLGALFTMSVSDRVTLIAAGAGAGIAATFNAPLGGIIFAVELLLVSTNARNIMLVATATVVATQISQYLLGSAPSFFVPALEIPDFHLLSNWGLPIFAALGILIGLLSVAFIRGLYAMEDVFDALPGGYYFHHSLGMLCVGIMMYLMLQYSGQYYVEGVGYATIMAILQGALSDPWFLLLLTALKLLATCLSLGSGASGGVFSPALFMGATGGAAFGHLCLLLVPGLDIAIPVFAIAGMAAAVAGTTGAVFTAIIMLTEMTMDSSITLGLVITCATAYVVRKSIMQDSIYSMKLRARGHTVPEGLHSAVLTSQHMRDLMSTDFVIVTSGDDLPTTTAVVVHSENGEITGVSVFPDDTHTAAGGSTSGNAARYVQLGEEATPLTAVNELWLSDASLVLVSRHPERRRAQDIVGIVKADVLARLLETNKRLS